MTVHKFSLPHIWLGLGAICLIAFWPVLGADFLDWDDNYNVYNNLRLRELHLDNLRWMFGDYGPDIRYKPVTYLAWALIHAAGGLNPFGFHLANLVMHFVNAGLVLLLLHRLIELAAGETDSAEGRQWRRLAAGAGALFWAVQPLRVETTAWVSVLSYSFVVFFLLLSTLAFLRCDFGRSLFRQRNYWLSLGLFQLGMMSFPIAVGFCFAILAVNIHPLRRVPVGDLRELFSTASRRALIETLPFFVLTAAMCVVAIYGQHVKKGIWGDPESLAMLPASARLLGAFYYLGYYAWRPFYPFHHYTVNEDLVGLDPAAPRMLFAILVVAGVTVGALALRRQNPAALAAWIAFVGLVGPALKLTGEPPTPGPGDRYSILCGVVTATVIAGLMQRARSETARHRWLMATAIVSLWFLVQSRSLAEQWRNNESFFTAQIRNLHGGPTLAKAHAVLGRAALARKDARAAHEHFTRAWERSPIVATATIVHEHADLLLAISQPHAAVELLGLAKQVQPGNYRIDLHRGIALMAAGRNREGAAICEDIMRRHPEDPDGFGYYASRLLRQGETERAREVLRAGVERHPDHVGLRGLFEKTR